MRQSSVNRPFDQRFVAPRVAPLGAIVFWAVLAETTRRKNLHHGRGLKLARESWDENFEGRAQSPRFGRLQQAQDGILFRDRLGVLLRLLQGQPRSLPK
jgi:hypothetical protein